MIFEKIYTLFTNFWKRFWGREEVYHLIDPQEELPPKLRPLSVYLIGEENDLWAVAFLCPCGCNDVIQLNLLKHGGRPCWTVNRGMDDRANLSPSVWRKVGCKSHFFLKEGIVKWC